jgi:hypothetical protein
VHVRTGIEMPARTEDILGVLFVAAGFLEGEVPQRDEPPGSVDAEGEPLARPRAIPRAVAVLTSGESELHRTADHARRQRGEVHVRPHSAARAEATADEPRDDPDMVDRDPKDGRQPLLVIGDPLRLVPHGEPVAVPGRDRREWLHRAVIEAGQVVHHVAARRRRRQGGLDISPASLGRGLLLRRLARRDRRARSHCLAEGARRRGRRHVFDADEPRGVRRILRRLRHHEGDALTLVDNLVALQHPLGSPGIRLAALRGSLRVRQARRIPVAQNPEHAGRPLGRVHLDRCDPAPRNRACYHRGVCQPRRRPDVCREIGPAGHLESSLDAAVGRPDARHHTGPPMASRARTMTRGRRSSLNAFWGRETAPSIARLAA